MSFIKSSKSVGAYFFRKYRNNRCVYSVGIFMFKKDIVINDIMRYNLIMEHKKKQR